jgi:hypothetical protein
MANTTFNGPVTSQNGFIAGHQVIASNAIDATATATAAQVATGYITFTSAAPTTITLPTGTLLGAALGATRGTTLDLYIDNTGGASTVTIAVATNGILSTAADDWVVSDASTALRPPNWNSLPRQGVLLFKGAKLWVCKPLSKVSR